MTPLPLPYLDAAALFAALPMPAAIDALERALLAGLDPAGDPARGVLQHRSGQLLLMPSAAGGAMAVKLVTIAPDNPERGMPRIQGLVVLFDPDTCAPVALLDGIAVTSLRTPAVSGLAARYLAAPGATRLVVFGSGPQAEGHVGAIRAACPIEEVVIVGRDAARARALAQRCAAPALHLRVGTAADVSGADVVVCATSAREPIFDSRLVPDGALVIAVGSHEPQAREVDAALVHRSRLVVEDVATALREAGDLVLAGVQASALESLADVVRAGRAEAATTAAGGTQRPSLVKTVGMAWEDAVIAAAATARCPVL